MVDLFPQAPYANISDVYDHTYYQIVTISTTVSFGISIILQPMYIYVVLKKSPKSMKTYQRLLLCYIFSSFLFEFGMITLKPLVLLPLMAIYPVGFFAPMSAEVALFLIFMVAVSLTAMADFLLTMLAQRYFTLIQFTLHKRQWISQLFYLTLAITNVLFIIAFCSLFYIDVLPTSEAQSLIFTHIIGSQPLLAWQPSFVVANYRSLFFAKIALILAGIFVFSRACCFCFFLYRNITLPKHLELHFSTQARLQHKMLITSISAQLFGIFLFLIFPFFIIFIFILFSTVLPGASKAWVLCMCFLNNFIIYDSIITVICIKHYRNFFIELFCRSKVPPRKVSVLAVSVVTKRTITN